MSEPPVIDYFLRSYHAQPEQGGAEKTLRRIVSALGQKRSEQERHFFIKLDSWHIGSLSLFRKPDEVLSSHQRQRGRHVAGPDGSTLLELDPEPLPQGDLDRYCAKVLAHFLGAACAQAEELVLLGYNQLPQIVWSDLLDLFSISHTPTELETMKSRSSLHSKSAAIFAGDPQTMAERSGNMLCAAAYPYYEKLEQLRLEQGLFRAEKF